MAKFWTWGVRVPSLLFVGLAIAIGASGVADWSVSLMAAALFGFIGEVAGHIAAKRARGRKKTSVAPSPAERAEAEADLLMQHIAVLGDSSYDEEAA